MLNWNRWLWILSVTVVTSACRAPFTVQNGAVENGVNAPVPQAKITDSYVFDHGRHLKTVESLQRARNLTVPSDSTITANDAQSVGHLAPVVRITEQGITLEDVIASSTELPDVAPTKPTIANGVRGKFKQSDLDPPNQKSALADQLRTATDSDRITVAQYVPRTGIQTFGSPEDANLGSPFLDDPATVDGVVVEGNVVLPPGVTMPPVADATTYGIPTEYPRIVESYPPGIGGLPTEYPLEQAPIEMGVPIVESPIYSIDELPPGCLTGPGFQVEAPLQPWRAYPDEYICDGGDANGSVGVLKDWSLRNLDPEDTVGHFDTLDGRVEVQPSNRVCIYAPRFAATRKVTAPYENEARLQAMSSNKTYETWTKDRQQIPDQVSQNLEAQRHLLVQPASVFRDRLPGVEASQEVRLLIVDKDLPAHEDFRVIKFGVHKQAEKTRLAEYTARAISWSHDSTVQVVLDEAIAQTRKSVQGIEEYFALGEKGSPKLRVIKTASVEDALPGEEVEFTLRFDNVGQQVIGNVTIIDNLATRLEFIEKSALCSVDAELVTETNDADSLTLRWEIAEPMKVGAGGIIRFRCRVR